MGGNSRGWRWLVSVIQCTTTVPSNNISRTLLHVMSAGPGRAVRPPAPPLLAIPPPREASRARATNFPILTAIYETSAPAASATTKCNFIVARRRPVVLCKSTFVRSSVRPSADMAGGRREGGREARDRNRAGPSGADPAGRRSVGRAICTRCNFN